MAKVAFLGLGVMGYPMAGHLANAGHSVTVYNRTEAKAEKWLEDYAGAGEQELFSAPTPAGAAADADVVFACVGQDKDVEEVCIGADGAFDVMQKGAVFVDHTTASADCARKMAAAAAERGLGFVDAPVSGGEAGAVNGALTIMCGGEAAHFEAAEPIMQAYGKSIRLLGQVGSGQLENEKVTPTINQIKK